MAYQMELYSTIERNEILKYATAQVNPGSIMLSTIKDHI
jgi:hypothetical protein